MVETIAKELGQEFKFAREKLGRDHAAISRDICVSRCYLTAIEEGRFDELPGQTFALGFIRSYAKSVHLDDKQAVDKFKRATMPPEPVEENNLVRAGGTPMTMDKMRGFNEAALATYKAEQAPKKEAEKTVKPKEKLNYSLLGGFLAVIALVATAGAQLPLG